MAVAGTRRRVRERWRRQGPQRSWHGSGQVEEARRALEELEDLEERGATYEDVLSGEAGACWIRESCDGDLGIAKAAYELRHPGAEVLW